MRASENKRSVSSIFSYPAATSPMGGRDGGRTLNPDLCYGLHYSAIFGQNNGYFPLNVNGDVLEIYAPFADLIMIPEYVMCTRKENGDEEIYTGTKKNVG